MPLRITHMGILARRFMEQNAGVKQSRSNMDGGLSGELDAAFSLLPAEQARQAKAQLLEAYARNAPFSLSLRWTEHGPAGDFLRGGITDMLGRSTRIVANTQEDPDILELARRARDNAALAGTIEPLPDGDRFALYLPFTPSRFDGVSEPRIRGFMVTEPIFREVLELMRPGVDLTASERRVLFQIVAGTSLREAAETDHVSFETKRAHLKVVSAKLHCSGQKDLLRVALGQLVHLLSVSEGEAGHAMPAEAFASRHFPEDAHLVVRRLPSGRILRAYESGPRDGRPLILIHGMMFPISLPGISRHLDANGIRLIVPIRSGFLESRSPAELAGERGLIGESFADLAACIEQEFDGRPATILGQSLGAVLAIRFANAYPALVSRLILQSINLTRSAESPGSGAGTFYGSLKRLSNNASLFKMVNWQYQKYYSDRTTGREILARIFGDCALDMDVLDGKLNGKEAYAMFGELYRTSVFGMSADFDFVMNAWQNEVRRIDKPITLIHGADDPLTRPSELERPDGKAGWTLITIPDGGHFIATSHPKAMWRAIADCLD